MPQFIGLIDFPSIKRWVFGTDRAREIRGASAILDDFNCRLVPQRLVEELGGGFEQVFMGGGSGLFIAEAPAIGRVERSLEKLALEISEKTGEALGFDWAVVPMTGGFQPSVARAHLLLGARKGASGSAQPRGRLGLLRECDSCSSPGVTGVWREGTEEIEWICDVCATKRRHRKEGRAWQDVLAGLDLADQGADYRPSDFGELAKMCPRPGYLGLVYMDGDSMGTLIQRIESPEQYRTFSETVDSALRQALVGALGEMDASRTARERGFLPCDVLLLGGDDLVVVTPADRALPLAISVAKKFRDHTKEKLGRSSFLGGEVRKHGLTVSAGVALFKDRQPLRMVLDQAEELLRSAKRRRLQEQGTSPYLDFADVSQTRFTKLEQLRQLELGVGTDRELTLWPMSLEEAERFWRSVEELARSGVRKGRVKALASIVASERSVSFESMRLVARERQHRQALLQFFEANRMFPHIPWRSEGARRRTGVLDLAALYPTLATGKESASVKEDK